MKFPVFIFLFFVPLFIIGQVKFDNAKSQSALILEEIINREDIVGASISVGISDSIVYSKGFGFADRDAGIKVQPYHKFRIYSVSKHIAAIAAAKLQEEGKLDLEKSITNYIPFLDNQFLSVTTAQLIGHTSGIRSYDEGEWQDVSNNACSNPFESILSFQSDSLLFDPGTDFSYTSFGYVMLSAIIEKVSGKPFINYLNDIFFEPNGILNVSLDNSDMTDHLAVKPYEYWQGVMYNARYANNTCKFGGGGLSASPSDVVLFNLALLQEKLVSNETLDLIFSSGKLSSGEDTEYGFGLEISKDDQNRFYAWHSGRSRGGRNALVIYPEEKIVVVLSANTNGDSIVEEAEKIAQLFLKEL